MLRYFISGPGHDGSVDSSTKVESISEYSEISVVAFLATGDSQPNVEPSVAHYLGRVTVSCSDGANQGGCAGSASYDHDHIYHDDFGVDQA